MINTFYNLVHSNTFKQDMLNANKAKDNFVPNYIRNNPDVKKVVSMVRNERKSIKETEAI